MNQHRHSINISQTSDDSQVISYLDIGSGPVLLFGHDYLFDNQMWTKQLLDLSQHYRCIVPDLWGHGQSQSLPKACLSLKALAEYHLALMDTLAIEKFSIIGSGIASMWGTELCLLAPTRVHTLTLLSCFLGFEPEVSKAKYDQILDELQQQQCFTTSSIDLLVTILFAQSSIDANLGMITEFKQRLAATSKDNINSLIRLGHIMFSRRDIMEDADKLTLPVLLMTGAENKLHPILESYLMHDAIDGSEFVHIPQAGQIAPLEQAEFVTKQLMAFLSKHH